MDAFEDASQGEALSEQVVSADDQITDLGIHNLLYIV